VTRNKVRVGLDIGSRYIKLAVRREEEITFDLRDNPLFSKKGDKDLLLESLKDLIEIHNLRGKEVISSLSGPSLTIQYFSFPSLSVEELKSAVKVEVEQVLNQDLSKIDFDYELLGKREKKNKVLFIACPREVTDARLTILRKIGLKPLSLTTDGMALVNSYFSRGKESPPVLLLNIGAKFTNLAVVEREKLFFIRDIVWGGEKIIQEVASNLEIDLLTAEKVLRDNRDKGEQKRLNLKDIIRKNSPSFVEELHAVSEYCADSEKIKIERIIISGGSSLFPFLPELLSERFGLPVEKWSSEKLTLSFSAGKKMEANLFTVAHGLLDEERYGD